MSRTDCHSPSKFDPSQYEYAYMLDLNPDRQAIGVPDPNYLQYCRDAIQRFRTGPRPASPKRGIGQCEHCGAHFLYGAIFLHLPTGEYIQVGNTCADEAFGHSSRRSYDLQKAKDRARAARHKVKMQAQALRFLRGFPRVDAILSAFSDRHPILDDIAASLARRGDLSSKQIALVLKLGREIASEAIDPTAGVIPPCEYCRSVDHKSEDCTNRIKAPTGKAKAIGRIVHTRVDEGYYGSTIKGLFVSNDGWKAWLTVPRAWLDHTINMDRSDVADVSFTLSGTFEPSEKDPYFAFVRRPRAKI
jgi:hypothetical protein